MSKGAKRNQQKGSNRSKVNKRTKRIQATLKFIKEFKFI